MLSYSPLRYPGGKARVANFVGLLLQSNTLLNGEYVEPFAGGASVAFALLFGQYVSRVHINDADPAVYACWDAMLNHSEKFCSWLSDVPLTVDEWKRQRDVYRSTTSASFDLGCATFYLNRTNRSGVIVQGGLIGGLGQTGNWLMDARFNRADLVRRVRRIADYRAAVSLTNLDASELLRGLGERVKRSRVLVYLDPPYYEKGRHLYKNFYSDHGGHAALCAEVKRLNVPWVVSYDNVEPVRTLYASCRSVEYGLQYSARERYEGKEVMFFSDNLNIPEIPNPTTVTFRTLAKHLDNKVGLRVAESKVPQFWTVASTAA